MNELIKGFSQPIMNNVFAFPRTRGRKVTQGKKKRRKKIKKRLKWMHDAKVTQKGHERKIQRTEREKHAIAKAALNFVSRPEGCDIFLQSLLAILISLHMSWIKIEFVWKRGRYWLSDCVCVHMYACVWEHLVRSAFLCATVHALVSEYCPQQSQPIHNGAELCFSHTSLSMQLTSAAPAYLMAKT